LSNITDLSFSPVTENVVDVIRFICSFPHLRHLTIYALRLESNSDDLTHADLGSLVLPQTLRKLHTATRISNNSLGREVWTNWMNIHPVLPIRTLSLTSCVVEHLGWTVNLAPFLRICDGSLVNRLHLDFDVRSGFSNVGDVETLVSSCKCGFDSTSPFLSCSNVSQTCSTKPSIFLSSLHSNPSKSLFAASSTEKSVIYSIYLGVSSYAWSQCLFRRLRFS